MDKALFARRSTELAFGRIGVDVIAWDLANGGFTVIDDTVERVIFSSGGIDFNVVPDFVGRKDGRFPSFAPEPESAATAGADALFGGSGTERIAGRGGDDRIEGAGGSARSSATWVATRCWAALGATASKAAVGPTSSFSQQGKPSTASPISGAAPT